MTSPELFFGSRYTPARLAQESIQLRLKRLAERHPEAMLPRYKREAGEFLLDRRGRPKPLKIDYNLTTTPLAAQLAKGKRRNNRLAVIASAYAERLVEQVRSVEGDPRIMTGRDWYELARGKITKHFGDDALLFAQLLGATSARTPARDNFEQALEAWSLWRTGAYAGITERYLELEAKLEAGEPLTFVETYSTDMDGTPLIILAGTPVNGVNFRYFLDALGVLPKKANGKRYNANSLQVLRVLAGTWEGRVGGPKTPNFARNLSGQGDNPFEATIDVWAARGLRRLGFEGVSPRRWRLLPESEQAVNAQDFRMGQSAYREAAKRLGIKPDALQGILWFAEKAVWSGRGWTRGAGAELSDFNAFLDKTTTHEGKKTLARAPVVEHTLFDLLAA